MVRPAVSSMPKCPVQALRQAAIKKKIKITCSPKKLPWDGKKIRGWLRVEFHLFGCFVLACLKSLDSLAQAVYYSSEFLS